MVKGGKVSSTRKFKTRGRSEYRGSDDSDEDYVISDEENEVSEELEEEYCSSAEGNASEESFGSFVEEEEEEDDEEEVIKVRKKSRSRARKGSDRFVVDEEEDEEDVMKVRKNSRSRGRKGSDSFVDDEEEDEDEEEVIKVRRNGRSRGKKGSNSFVVDEEEDEDEEEVIKVRNNSRSRGKKGSDNFVVDEEEDEEEVIKVRNEGRSRAKKGSDSSFVEEEEEEEEEDEVEMKQVRRGVRSKVQNGFSGRQKNGNPSRKRGKITYQEDQDYDDVEDDDDDEEFTPDEDDFSELEEKPVVKKRKITAKVGKGRMRKKGPVRGAKRRKPLAPKKPLRKKGRNNHAGRRNVRCDDGHESDGAFMDRILPVREQNEKKRVRKRRRLVVPSDSDFASSGSSDCDYTISEEEREQVREALELSENVKTNLRSSSVSTNIQEERIEQQPRKVLRRKGKEKIEPVKVEVVKQVCGICLSEEDKRRVRGTLDCCTHYFCFACIMEWGKVESRCPLCKQRFKTISKPGRFTTGIDLREVVIQVPERDQVYQPTEEELRSYLDPYENVICTECHEGGEDGLMLLCDLCDSPAHTYCVGLGREVPEGNWYCEGCKPVAMGSSSSQVQGQLSDQRTSNNILSNRPSPVVNFDGGVEIDLNSMASPRSHINQGFAIPPSPRFPVGGFQAASPVAGAGVPTLSGRRVLQRHIQQLIHANRASYLASITERNSSANLSNDFLNSQVVSGRETTVQHTRTDEMEASYHTFFEERLQFNPLVQVQDNGFFSSTTSQLGRQVIQDPTTTSAGRSLDGALWPELIEMNSVADDGQFHHFGSRPNIGAVDGVSPNTAIEQSDFHIAKEQLKVTVKHHLGNLSRDIDLDKDTFKDIARRSTHTVLAACGHEHRSNEVVDVPPPACSHIELVVGGKTSLMRGCCSSCFESFVAEVVQRILDTKPPHWLNLGL